MRWEIRENPNWISNFAVTSTVLGRNVDLYRGVQGGLRILLYGVVKSRIMKRRASSVFRFCFQIINLKSAEGQGLTRFTRQMVRFVLKSTGIRRATMTHNDMILYTYCTLAKGTQNRT